MQCHVLLLENDNREIHLLSPFTKEKLKNVQSKSELFFGQLIEPAIGVIPGNITYNKDFMIYMHALVRDTMVNDPGVLEEVGKQENGMVFIIDQRSPAVAKNFTERVDAEDIIGLFVCKDRQTDVTMYRPNPNYLLISSKGIGQLPPEVEEKFDELLKP